MQKDKTLISVIIPSYNRADTVGETIESIVAQEGIGVEYDLEIVIGDDCSSDNAREVLEQYRQKYPDLIRLFLREQNVGLGANWAMCVKDCGGKYICNCDNDDYWHNPRKLHLQFEYMESHSDCNVLLTNHHWKNRQTGETRECEAWIDRAMPLEQAIFIGHTGYCNATIMYRTDFLRAHVCMDDFIAHQFTLQDWNTWMLLAPYTDFDILPVSTATWCQDNVSITRPRTYEQVQKRYDKELDCYRYCIEKSPNNLPFDEPGWYKYVNHQLVRVAYQRNDYAAARGFAKEAAKGMLDKMTCTWLTFTLYRWYKMIRKTL